MKRILSVVLSVVFLLTALPLGVVAVSAAVVEAEEVDLAEVFQSNLNFLDQYYILGPEFMVSKLCGVLYSWEEAEANNFAVKPMPAAEFEEVLYRYFAPTEEQLMGIRNYPRYDYATDTHSTFYDPDTGMYNLFVVGGFGGDMPQRQYQRYLKTEDGYTVFYAHITYDYLPETPEIMAELEALDWPFTFTYEGKEYENGPDGYTRVASVDDYGNKYEVQYNDGILRILSQTPYAAASESDFQCSITDGEVTILGYTGAGGEVVIPATLGGYPVTAIGFQAFYNCTSLISVMISDSVTVIEDYAFFCCSSLTSVIIPDSVTAIGMHAFSSCPDLARVTMGDGVTTIGEHAFGSCVSLKSIAIGNGVATIGRYAFDGCKLLSTVMLPDSVTTIGMSAFGNCSSLTEVYYAGSEEARAAISFDFNNECLLNATWHYAVASVIPGDADGDGEASMQDAALLQRYLNGWDEEPDASACDVNGDGACDNKDLVLLVRYLNGWDVELKKS